MAVTVNLKKQVDLPVWEWLRFAPATTAATSAMAMGDTPGERYIYYLNGAAFYRYDTVSDTWSTLASPNVAAVTGAALRVSSNGGFRGRVLGAGASTLTIPGLRGNALSGYQIRISHGKGAGQVRTITGITDATVWDTGLVTAASATVLTDTTKKWAINQWAGYQVAIKYGTGATQYRKILYNDQTSLYVSDPNYQQIDPWNNTGFSAIAPYAVPVATAGAQATYSIESSVLTVDTPWATQPDTTSRFNVLSGSVWFLSSAAAAPFYTLQVYDIASDTWCTRTATQGLLLAALGTDFTLERLSNGGGVYVSGTATAGGPRYLTSPTTMTLDRYTNYQIRITGGTGMGQRRRIVGNNTTQFFVNRKWDTTPDNTSTFEVWDDIHTCWFGGGAASALYQHNVEADLPVQGPIDDWGLARVLSIRLNNYGTWGWEDHGITSGARNTNGITSINPTPVAGGTGYVMGEVITLGTGTNGKVIVTGINPGGIVTSVALFACGSGYAVATASQSATTGAGTGLQIAVSTIGTIGKITTALNHHFKVGDSVILSGDALWAGAYTVLGADTLTTLEVAITAAGAMTAANALSTTVLVDCSASWDVNEHVGKLVCITVAGAAPTSQIRRITANTATTLTLQSAITTAVNGTSRYAIYGIAGFGADDMFKVPGKTRGGWATGGSTTTLVDSTKNWNVNQWVGTKVRIMTGTGLGSEITITSNTATTLTYATQTFTPDATTKYQLMDTFGLATSGSTTTLVDTTKAWVVNQWAGKRVRITSGTGVGQEFTVASNTATTLTFTAITTAPDATSTYVIYGVPVRGAGSQLYHMFGLSDASLRGRIMLFPRGGASNVIDRYDIPTDTWDYAYYMQPQSETLTTGSMYNYDGKDTFYMQKDATGRVYAYNVAYNKVDPAGTVPYGHGAALIGNRMEILTTADGIKYLYMMRHTGTEMWRTLLFWT